MVKTIIWIEDDTDVIDPVVRPLERAGHCFIRLHTVREALDAMDTMRQADLILLDIALPPTDAPCDIGPGNTLIPDTGLQLLQQLREASAVKTPVVVLTDLRCPQLEGALQALNVADIIYMPVRPTELHQRIEAVWTAPTGRN